MLENSNTNYGGSSPSAPPLENNTNTEKFAQYALDHIEYVISLALWYCGEGNELAYYRSSGNSKDKTRWENEAQNLIDELLRIYDDYRLESQNNLDKATNKLFKKFINVTYQTASKIHDSRFGKGSRFAYMLHQRIKKLIPQHLHLKFDSNAKQSAITLDPRGNEVDRETQETTKDYSIETTQRRLDQFYISRAKKQLNGSPLANSLDQLTIDTQKSLRQQVIEEFKPLDTTSGPIRKAILALSQFLDRTSSKIRNFKRNLSNAKTHQEKVRIVREQTYLQVRAYDWIQGNGLQRVEKESKPVIVKKMNETTPPEAKIKKIEEPDTVLDYVERVLTLAYSCCSKEESPLGYESALKVQSKRKEEAQHLINEILRVYDKYRGKIAQNSNNSEIHQKYLRKFKDITYQSAQKIYDSRFGKGSRLGAMLLSLYQEDGFENYQGLEFSIPGTQLFIQKINNNTSQQRIDAFYILQAKKYVDELVSQYSRDNHSKKEDAQRLQTSLMSLGTNNNPRRSLHGQLIELIEHCLSSSTTQPTQSNSTNPLEIKVAGAKYKEGRFGEMMKKLCNFLDSTSSKVKRTNKDIANSKTYENTVRLLRNQTYEQQRAYDHIFGNGIQKIVKVNGESKVSKQFEREHILCKLITQLQKQNENKQPTGTIQYKIGDCLFYDPYDSYYNPYFGYYNYYYNPYSPLIYMPTNSPVLQSSNEFINQTEELIQKAVTKLGNEAHTFGNTFVHWASQAPQLAREGVKAGQELASDVSQGLINNGMFSESAKLGRDVVHGISEVAHHIPEGVEGCSSVLSCLGEGLSVVGECFVEVISALCNGL